MNFIFRVFLNILSLISILIINIIIFYKKKNKKKILFVYLPHLKKKKNYYSKIFNKIENNFIIYSTLNLSISSNFYTIKPSYLKFIMGVDFFFSDYVVDKFTPRSKRVYIHHDIYDTPLVSRNKEKELSKRLLRYNFILIPSVKSLKVFKLLFKKYKKKPKILILGEYPKLTSLLKKNIFLRKKGKPTIVIAPSGFYGIPKLSIKDHLQKIIIELLKIDIQIILRPHPSNRNHKIVKVIENKFKKINNFKIDISDDYSKIYSKSSLLITDYSGTAYTYAMYTLNPVIFISLNKNYINKLNYNSLNYFKDRKKIGLILNNYSKITEKVKYILKIKKKISNNINNIKKTYFINSNSNNNLYLN